MANNKPSLRLNKKNIDETDTGIKKDTRENNTESDFIKADSFSTIVKDTPSPFEVDHVEETNETENPFDQNESESDNDVNEESIDPNNPFIDDDDDDDDFPYTAPTDDPPLDPTGPNVDLIIDPEMPYFFVFGNASAGKSAMLSGLLYDMQSSGLGQLHSLSHNDQIHHMKGDYIVNKMRQKVSNGEFVDRSRVLDKTEFVFPTEINLEFKPHNKMTMPFCLLEMAGEDLTEIELRDEGRSGGDFDERIKAYLQHDRCKLKFICVVDVNSPEQSQELIHQFLLYIRKLGHISNPLLITVNKWDKVADRYDNVKEYFKDKLPILANDLLNSERDMAYMSFSMGEVISDPIKGDSYKFQPNDSRKLLNWMYETATGQSLNEELATSWLSKIISYFKNLFSNE